ncbi:unnamed protein product [Arabidopsis arenosa]|uniref:Uncharacterized protein n=1 Tax=Arabidopsis arenosa TaxID=38785 RepID=A0A8S1ZWA2_ARAAE|nr:unnamed protein product [Arabidopsis arenosa]
MDRSTYYHSSSTPNSPASEPSSPMPPDSPKFDVERFHRWTGRSQPEVGFPLSTLTCPSVEPIYPWDKVPGNGNGPDIQPAERDFVPGKITYPKTFFARCPGSVFTKNQHWVARDMERGMRRLEAHPKDWLRYEFDKFGDMSWPLRYYCLTHDGSSCEFRLSPPDAVGPVTDEDDEDSSDGSSFDSHPDSLFY